MLSYSLNRTTATQNHNNSQSGQLRASNTSIRSFGLLNTSFPFRNFLSFLSRQPNTEPVRSITQSAPSVSSAPVLVTTYSGPRARARFLTMSSSSSGSAPPLPPVSAFTFSHVLLAIDDQIQPAITGLSAICAKSRLSLASEYDAHLPPQGEIMESNPAYAMNPPMMPPRGTLGRTRSLWVRTTGFGADGWDRGTALSVVLEAENSSGSRSSVSASASEAGTLRSALGSLREVLNKGSPSKSNTKYTGKGKERAVDEETHEEKISWAIQRKDERQDGDEIVVIGSPRSRVTVSTTSAVIAEDDGPVEGQLGGSGWLGWSRGVGLGMDVQSTLRGILDSSTSRIS
jgi:hypothetical protein